jgi:hypothetical protein
MAETIMISISSAQRIWRTHDLQPHSEGKSTAVSTDLFEP